MAHGEDGNMTTFSKRHTAPVAALVFGAALMIGNPVKADQVIPDDLIVQGSACAGLDCVNNESFGFSTLILKENNTRIRFLDTSTAAGFPKNVWDITANDSASGGASYLAFDDITGSKQPFRVTAGAPTASLFVDGGGRVGLRTATPVLDMHINTGNTPAHRLEQNNSGGFAAQTWDIAGNEANFFVRDVTSGSRLPFRIRPGAPTSSIDIAASGNVGIGTASPSSTMKLDVNGDLKANNVFAVSMPAGSSVYSVCLNPTTNQLIWAFNVACPSSSDAGLKKNIESMSSARSLEQVLKLRPVTFDWIDAEARGKQRNIGFVAQEVKEVIPDLVVRQDDGNYSLQYEKMSAVLAGAIQQLKADNDNLRREIEELKREVHLLARVVGRRVVVNRR